jgi:MFS family permease
VRGFGGITGAIVSAVMTEYFHPKWCILIYSILGFFIAYSGIMLNKEIDKEGLSEMNGFFTDLKKSFKELWEIRKIPEIYKVILFILLRGFFSPSFGEFYYYFIKDIKHWS